MANANKYKIACITLVLCQNTLATWVSLFEPVKYLYPNPRPIINNIILKYLKYLVYFATLNAKKDEYTYTNIP